VRVQIEYLVFFLFFFYQEERTNKVKPTILGEQLQEHRQEGSDAVEEVKKTTQS